MLIFSYAGAGESLLVGDHEISVTKKNPAANQRNGIFYSDKVQSYNR